MHRGSHSDYRRPPCPPPGYGPPPAAGPRSSFPGPFNRPNFPPHFQNPVSYPRLIPPLGCQSFSNDPVYQTAPPAQFPAGWTLHQDELESLEVKKKAEEFLRILEAKDRLQLPSESRDKDMRRSSVDDKTKRRSSEKHPRGRSRSKSRSRSRERSRAKSRARSRGKSRTRSRSRSRGRSHTRAKSRPRTQSHSRSRERSLARSKSQPRFLKDSQYSVKHAAASPSVSGTVPDLFQNLKQVLQSKELEKHLTVVRNTFMLNQTQEDANPKHETLPKPLPNLPHVLTGSAEPERPSDLNMNSVLPHEQVGGSNSTLPRILSWNDPGRNPEALKSKSVFSSIEDEEEFLYGDEEGRKKPQAVTVPLAQNTLAEKHPISSLCLSNPLNLQQSKSQTVISKQPLSPDVSVEECERVKNLLKTIGLNLGQADISKMVTRLKQKQEDQRGPSLNVTLRTTLETLLTRYCGVQKSDDARGTRSESSHPHRDGDHKIDEREKELREKQIQKKRKEYLVKELEGLLKQEGSGDLIPVIGFFCQRCEEFFGDLSSAEGHKHPNTPQIDTRKPENADEQIKDDKKQRERKHTESRDKDEQNTRRKRPRDDASPRVTEKRKEDKAESSKSTRWKKKKDKKGKKKKKKEKNKEKERDKAVRK